MSEQAVDDGIAIARDYYDSPDADDFYRQIWGGEDIHVGLYETTSDIRTASRKTIERIAQKLGPLDGKHIVDLGSGYGGAARVLASEYGARVTCINLSTKENARNRELTEAAGLSDRISILDGSFDDMPFEDGIFDVAWSQDAILHAPDREKVLDEVARVLKPGGLFAFTDPMQADGLDDARLLQPIYDRIHLPDLASVAFYRAKLRERDFEEVEVEELPHDLGRHYAKVREVMLERQDEAGLTDAFVDRMRIGLGHWVEGAASGHLNWAIMVFRKN
ncbi:methyltransferase domain-containing protein [Erythrobacter sp.]|uniref:methyltransferase domain-containing protein n=1 Tax=Erythrobacter sp. TaxID=1042 RepID=UPI001AFF122A|nr:methyltransferase domain-containing protein [Erythrobacter sp.]MBO6527083.1 methyltransferase domain-containing protein [Erythrobacter sp.]MBO6528963.1 methyltransferase domain-containing protein [Erythrobacter sp.]